VPILFEQQHAPTLFCQQRTSGATARAAAYDHDIRAAFVDGRQPRERRFIALGIRIGCWKHGCASVSIGAVPMTRICTFSPVSAP
jgi:hypothetical protein